MIIDETPINPKYYEKMSELLDALIKERRAQALGYQEYLKKIVELTKQIKRPGDSARYPRTLTALQNRLSTTTSARTKRSRSRSMKR